MDITLFDKIRLVGMSANVNYAQNVINANKAEFENCGEGATRIVLMQLIEKHGIKCSVLYSGNTVWNRAKLVKDVKAVVKNGMESMSDYLYKFLSLACGSIAHYNKGGWIDYYPTVDDLREFFRRNEFGERVSNHIPSWHTDAKVAVEDIENVLGI